MNRYAVVHDIDGPKVRLGVVWFGLTVGGCLLARPLLAIVLAVAAALAADQVVRFHDRRVTQDHRDLVRDPVRLVAVIGAAALPLAAIEGSDTLAGAMAVAVALAVLVAGGRAPLPVLGALAMGLGAASPVLLHRLGTSAALFLIVLVAAYDAGDFIVGTGAGTTWEGPAAGICAVAVAGFGSVVIAPPPLIEEGSATLAVLVALLAPLGPPVASLLIGDGATPARFVRRIDSLLVCGPFSAYVIAALLPRLG